MQSFCLINYFVTMERTLLAASKESANLFIGRELLKLKSILKHLLHEIINCNLIDHSE